MPQREAIHAGVPRIKGFRYPAPGSQPLPAIPVRENEDGVYNTQHYSRDPSNLPLTDTTTFNSSAKSPVTLAPKVKHIGSPGTFKNPAVATYDPTGLRATMSATWGALEKAAITNAAPNHLPAPSWLKDVEEISAECDRKGIPQALGKRWKPSIIPVGLNDVKW